MLGLSITAIGMRPFLECLQIWQILEIAMELEFLELAIGSTCDVNFNYVNIPLVLHDSCLYERRVRYHLDIFERETWEPYHKFALFNDVRALTLHPPLKRYCTQLELEKALQRLQRKLKIPVYLEIMPSREYWCSSIDTLVDFPLLLDISHINIWHQGNLAKTQQTCLSLLESCPVKAIHLSHNQGKRDSHDLIPQDVWFISFIQDWRRKFLVTYESLPIDFAIYQRLDKKKTAH